MIRKLASLLLSVVLFGGSAAWAALAADGTYQLDPDHTNIGFEVSHLGVSFVVGRFDKFQGTVKLVSGGNTQISVQVDPSSIDTKVDQRDNHLRSADFFDVAHFPTAKFDSVNVTFDSQGNPATVQGNLTLHGVTKPVTLTVTPIATGLGPAGETRVGFHAVTSIKRTDFGMKNLLALAGDQVTITMNIEAVKQ
jgi:polyisoprenoid-binding protein YceI